MDDLISRSALIERYGEPCRSFLDIIESMPAVDAVPMDFHERCLLLEVQKRHAAEANQRHGRWIHDINNLFGCSECMERDTMSFRRGLKNYCPNCGAKMDGDVNATD